MFKKKSVKYILLSILLLVGIGALYAYKEYNRKQKDVADITASFSLTCKSIIDEFTADEKTANMKYLDKVIDISGTLKSIDKDDNGYYTLVVGDTTINNSSVRCSMDSIHNNEASNMKVGNEVKVRGICTGFNADELGLGSDVIINRTYIVK